MADAEDTAGELAEACAERHVKVLENNLTQAVRAVSFWRVDGSQRVRILRGILRHDVQAPRASGCTCRLTMPDMTLKYVLKTLFFDHAQRFTQAVEKIGRGGLRKEPRLVEIGRA